MRKSFAESLRDLLVTLARMLGREVSEGQVDLKLDSRWYIIIGLFFAAIGGIVYTLIHLKSPVLILGIVVLGVFGFIALVRSRASGKD